MQADTVNKSNPSKPMPTVSTATEPLLVNEVLCYSIGKFVKIPVKNLKSVICNFYNDSELSVAKDELIL